MTDRRKAKGRGHGGEVEPFAKMPRSVLQSEAVRTLDHAAFRILVIVTCDCWYHPLKCKGRNGTAAFTEVYAKSWGFKGRDTLYRALAQLVERGLLVKTRDGQRIRNRFALYGVGWLPITHENGAELEQHRPAPNLWRHWKPAAASIPMVGSDAEKFLTDGRECSIPMAGSGEGECVPTIGNTDPKYVPTIGHTSLLLGDRVARTGPQGHPVRGDRGQSHDSRLVARVVNLFQSQPHLRDADIARACKIDDPTKVAAMRARWMGAA